MKVLSSMKSVVYIPYGEVKYVFWKFALYCLYHNLFISSFGADCKAFRETVWHWRKNNNNNMLLLLIYLCDKRASLGNQRKLARLACDF